MTETSAGPLSGVRVLDMSRVLAGPFAAQILAEMGADVVKLESLRGDPARNVGPFRGERSLYFAAANSGKRGIAVDTRSEAGRAVLEDLIAAADVLLHNFRLDAASALGLDEQRLTADHPHLVSVVVTGYAGTSSRGGDASYDLMAQAEAGLLSVTGHPEDHRPTRSGVPVSDLTAALWVVIAAQSGLLSRRQGHPGGVREVPLLDATLPLLSYLATAAHELGVDPPKVGTSHHRLCPYDTYPTNDGWVAIGVFSDKFWDPLCHALGLKSLAQDVTLAISTARVKRRQEIDAAVTYKTQQLSQADACRRLDLHGVPNAPVHTVLEALDSPYAQERGLLRAIDTADGPYAVVRSPLAMDGLLRAAPLLDEHHDEVLSDWLGR
jgi:CoA:oxalate CoA-transferase